MKLISKEHSDIILKELLRRVGQEDQFGTFDFSREGWFLEYTWTPSEEDDFRKWLGEFLVKHKYAMKGKYRGMNAGYYQAGKLIFNYGWKTKLDI